MSEVICLNKKHSTTRSLLKRDQYSNSSYPNIGGLRRAGYFSDNGQESPLISVITVVYNSIDTIEKTILSVINQTINNIDYIIVDGCSTDGTVDILKKYDNEISLWISGPDLGIYDAMNRAIKLANGEWLNFVNSGDTFFDCNSLSNLREELCSDNSIIYSDTVVVNGEQRRIAKADFRKFKFIHQSIIYKKEVHNKYGNYLVDRGLTISDYIFFTQLIDEKAVKVEDQIAIFYEDGISSNSKSVYDKVSYDYMSGRVSKLFLINILLFYPIYRKLKQILRIIFLE